MAENIISTDQPRVKRNRTCRSKNHGLTERMIETLDAERPMTCRQLYYRMISAGLIQNSEKEYKRIIRLATELRESGDIPRPWIVDNTRATIKPSSWSGLADFADTLCDAYRRDFWASMQHHIEIFVEKDAIAGTIQPITNEYDIGLNVCRGYASVSFASVIAEQWKEIEKPIYCYYLGDFDASGFDIERDLKSKLQRYSGRQVSDEQSLLCFSWKRIGVCGADFHKHDLIKLPVKKTDRRAAKFIQEHGTSCAEVDAIPPTELRSRVRAIIESHIDQERWTKLKEIETLERETIDSFFTEFGDNDKT